MALLNGLIAALEAINRLFLWIGRTVSTVFLGVMLILVLAHVTLRLLAESPSWTEEVTIFMMIWIAFLVAPIAYRAGGHVSIELLKSMLGRRLRLALEILLSIAVIAIMVILLWLAVPFIEQGFGRPARAVNIYIGWFYLCTAYGYIGIMTAGLELILREVRALVDEEYSRDPVIRHAMVDDLGEAGMTGVNPTPDRLDRGG